MRVNNWLYLIRLNRLEQKSSYHWKMNSIYLASGNFYKAVKHGRKAVLLDCKIDRLQGGRK
jgi:hypothetical protein